MINYSSCDQSQVGLVIAPQFEIIINVAPALIPVEVLTEHPGGWQLQEFWVMATEAPEIQMSEIPNKYDAIIVGGGHNGLVASAYLGRAGFKVLVLERRQIVGGSAVTEEFVPGFKFSSLADDAGSFSPEVALDLELRQHGLKTLPTDPLLLSLLPDGNHLTIWHDINRAMAEIKKFSVADAQAFPKFVTWMQKISRFVREVNNIIPPDLPDVELSDLRNSFRFVKPVRGLRWKHIAQVIRLMPMSVADLLDEWFESEIVKGAIAASAILNISYGPREINSTAYALLNNWAHSNNGLFRSNLQVQGGMGGLTQALKSAAMSWGVDIQTNAEVARINIKDGVVAGVTLADGTIVSANVVVSAVDMRTTFLNLVDPYYLEAKLLRHVKNIIYRGTMMRIHFALERLPTCSGLDSNSSQLLSGHVQIAPTLTYLQKAFDPAKYGHYSTRPYLDIQIPSIKDPSLAPEGKHTMSATVKYMPYELQQGSWDEQRETVSEHIIDSVSDYFPDFRECIVQYKTITPLDLETIYGLPEGNPLHGEMVLSQFMWMRPIPGYARYCGPFEGLYLCSVATHPGGGVTGINGKNSARQILNEVKL